MKLETLICSLVSAVWLFVSLLILYICYKEGKYEPDPNCQFKTEQGKCESAHFNPMFRKHCPFKDCNDCIFSEYENN